MKKRLKSNKRIKVIRYRVNWFNLAILIVATGIVLRLLISKSNIDKVVKTYIYLTEDMFDLDSFKYIDKELGLGDRKISTDDLIKLRALRVAFNVIKAINTTS